MGTLNVKNASVKISGGVLFWVILYTHFIRKLLYVVKSDIRISLLLMKDVLNYLLALLDYVSRAHEIEIRPSSVRRPSVCGIDYL